MFVALGIPHAMRMRRIILSTVASLPLLDPSTFSYKLHDVGGGVGGGVGVTERKMYVLIFGTIFA